MVWRRILVFLQRSQLLLAILQCCPIHSHVLQRVVHYKGYPDGFHRVVDDVVFPPVVRISRWEFVFCPIWRSSLPKERLVESWNRHEVEVELQLLRSSPSSHARRGNHSWLSESTFDVWCSSDDAKVAKSFQTSPEGRLSCWWSSGWSHDAYNVWGKWCFVGEERASRSSWQGSLQVEELTGPIQES